MAEKRSKPQPPRKPLPPKKPTGEYALFTAIAAVREPICYITGQHVNIWQADGTLNVSCFLHVLSKAPHKFPKFKLFEKNIVIGQPWVHTIIDHGTIEQQKELDKYPGWERYQRLREELKELYNKKGTGITDALST